MTRAALEGLRVLDLSSNAPGPFCTMVLADLGAEVTVVDRPAAAPGSRPDEGVPNASADGLARPHFDAFARNKRRIGVNLKQDGGAEVVQRLAASADVIVVEMRPGKPEALGIGYADLSALNNRLIYCSITGYGQTGPLRDRAGHDLNYLGHSGALSLFARRASPPVPPPNAIADYGATGLLAATSILAALQARHVTGEGQYIDLSMMDATTYLLAEWISTTFDPQGDPNILADYPPYDVYACADGRLLTIGCVEPHFWKNLCAVIGRNDLVYLAGNPSAYGQLRSELERVFASEPRAVWLERLEAHDLPVATVNDLDELPDDPHIRAREMIINVDSEHGMVKQVGIGPKLSATPGSIRRLGVPHGADTDQVLAELGYPSERVAQLRSAGAVFG